MTNFFSSIFKVGRTKVPLNITSEPKWPRYEHLICGKNIVAIQGSVKSSSFSKFFKARIKSPHGAPQNVNSKDSMHGFWSSLKKIAEI